MYHALLLRRYLTTKVLPILAAAAVALCTMIVLVVWSIMGGFLGVLLDSGRTLVGDVIIAWPTIGFGHYEELMSDLEKDPAVAASTPMIETFGVLNLPDRRIQGVYIKGIQGSTYNRVTKYADSLWWKPLEEPLPKDSKALDPRITSSKLFLGQRMPQLLDHIEAALATRSDLPKLEALRSEFVSLRQEAKMALAQPVDTAARQKAILAVLEHAENIGATAATATRDTALFRASTEAPMLLGDLTRDFRDMAQAVGAAERRWSSTFDDGIALTHPDPQTGAGVPAMVPGMEVSGFNIRYPEGYYQPAPSVFIREDDGSMTRIDGRLVGRSLTLNVLPMNKKGRSIDMVSRAFPVANEFKTGVYDIDKSTVLVELGALQKMLRMDEATILDQVQVDPYEVRSGPGGESFARGIGASKAPARVTTILVRGKDGVPLAKVRDACAAAYEQFSNRHPRDVPSIDSIRISTWEQEQGTLIAAVKKEIVMMLFLLGLISLTVSVLILAIFWAIVSEKTKDIGILRAIGAGRAGVMWIWLGYGLVIGVIGASLGMTVAFLIVHNINPIHDWLGQRLGITVWDPRIYYFTQIPSKVDPYKAIGVFFSGIFFSVLGALLPAVRASRMDPVRSLRFE